MLINNTQEAFMSNQELERESEEGRMGRDCEEKREQWSHSVSDTREI